MKCNHELGIILWGTEHQEVIFLDNYRVICRNHAKEINKINDLYGKPHIKGDDLIKDLPNRKFKRFYYCPECGAQINWRYLLNKL